MAASILAHSDFDPFPKLVASLESEYGTTEIAALARLYIDAEYADFHWDARMRERWIGSYESMDDDDFELDRVAIFGWLDGQYFVAVMLVDGDGNAHGMMGKHIFQSERDARTAFAEA